MASNYFLFASPETKCYNRGMEQGLLEIHRQSGMTEKQVVERMNRSFHAIVRRTETLHMALRRGTQKYRFLLALSEAYDKPFGVIEAAAETSRERRTATKNNL